MSFLHNSLTRRTIIQAIYQNHFFFETDLRILLKDDEFLSPNIENQELFLDVMQSVIDIWDYYEKIFDFLGFEYDLRSMIALSILKGFIGEFLLKKVDDKILINEYLILFNVFCPSEAAEMKILLNKLLKADLAEIKTRLITA